jgi:hypothetical protein
VRRDGEVVVAVRVGVPLTVTFTFDDGSLSHHVTTNVVVG